MTLEEIGADLGITRERVRQIEAAALNRLRGLVI
jgi:DNA-directed RNA polymerase sigma subunit (sigma70/sigma32)